jgi:hypothetical protein
VFSLAVEKLVVRWSGSTESEPEVITVEVVEQFLASKTGRPMQCEDGIVVTRAFAAVIDGGTDKTGLRYSGTTGGRYVMLACDDALQSLDPDADCFAAIRWLTKALAARLPSGLSARERPEAVLTVYSQARREIWQIGDVGFWHLGQPDGGVTGSKLIDRYAADIRAAILHVELDKGASQSDLARNDPGRRAILGLLKQQAGFRNNLAAHELAYPAIDGCDVPAKLIIVQRIPNNVTELVIASDGYPDIRPSLEVSENELSELLASDPLCIDKLRSTKGVTPGNLSFDDRAYLRLMV